MLNLPILFVNRITFGKKMTNIISCRKLLIYKDNFEERESEIA